MNKILIRVKEIRENCAVFKGGESIVIDGSKINIDMTDKICIHALVPLLQYVVALRERVPPAKLGFAKNGDKAYVRCVDLGEPYTADGTVIFEITRVD